VGYIGFSRHLALLSNASPQVFHLEDEKLGDNYYGDILGFWGKYVV
jgi:hypothetical protein